MRLPLSEAKRRKAKPKAAGSPTKPQGASEEVPATPPEPPRESGKAAILRIKREEREAFAAQRVADEAARQKRVQAAKEKRRYRQPAPVRGEIEDENDMQLWVRDNMEWNDHAEMWQFDHCSYSDYSGSFEEKANCEWILANIEGARVHHYGYGGETVGIPEQVRLAFDPDSDESVQQFDTLKETVENLEDYPDLDEQRSSELRQEAEWEAWDDYGGRKDARTVLIDEASAALVKLAWKIEPNAVLDDLFRDNEGYNYTSIEYLSVNIDVDMWLEREGGAFYPTTASMEQAKQAMMQVFIASVRDRFERQIERRWVSEHPEWVHAAHNLTEESGLKLVNNLLYAIDDPSFDWTIGDHDHDETVEQLARSLTLDNDAIAAAVEHLSDVQLRKAMPDDPRQMTLPMESRVNRVVAYLLEEAA
jgi:hypothetical protein